MLFDSPLDPEQVNTVVRLLPLTETSHVVDIGCGHGELLLRVLEQHGCRGTGVDPDAWALGSLEAAAQGRGVSSQLTCEALKAEAFPWPEEGIDLLVSVGAVHALGGLAGTLTAARERVKPGGCLLLGDLIWRQPPSRPYVDVIGEEGWAPFDRNLFEFVQEVERAGLQTLYATESSPAAWDAFEGGIHLDRLQTAREESDPARRDEKLRHARDWYRAYLQWGRDAMGFALGLFQLPPTSANS